MLVNEFGNGVGLVTRMQPRGNLENSWIMFDHFKHIVGWTTMVCHVFDMLQSHDHCNLQHAI
jgi:hypothetical protein